MPVLGLMLDNKIDTLNVSRSAEKAITKPIITNRPKPFSRTVHRSCPAFTEGYLAYFGPAMG